MTDVDPAAAFRGTYTDARGAAQALREHGAGTLIGTVRSWFPAEKSIHFAHRGDIVMRDRFTTGVCVGRFSWFVGLEHGVDGLIVIPTATCRYAFAVAYE